MSSPTRTFFRFVATLFAPILLFATSAHAVQTSASVSLYPTNWGLLPVGEEIDIMVVVNNTSTDTPANAAPDDGVDPVPALLTGTITVQLACDGTCSAQVPGKLAFVPVGGSGCVEKIGAVTTCSAAGPNDVVIGLKPAGVTLGAGASVDIATIRVKVIDNTNVGQLGLKGFTEPGSIRACSTNAPDVCATCSAVGCTTLVFGKTITTCPHACPERIIFRGGPNDPDFFEFHSLILPKAPLDPPNQPFALTLANASFAQIFSVPQIVPVGGKNFVPQGAGTWTYRNPDARTTGGIAFIKISARNDIANAYKIDIQAFDPALEARATVPNMTVSFSLGVESFTTNNDWTKKPNGWTLNLP